MNESKENELYGLTKKERKYLTIITLVIFIVIIVIVVWINKSGFLR